MPPLAASATSGTIIDAVNAAAVSPVTTFSFNEALTANFPTAFDAALDGLTGSNGFKKAAAEGGDWAARANGIAMETAHVEAIGVGKM